MAGCSHPAASSNAPSATRAGDEKSAYTPSITMEQARSTALAEVPGKILDGELEKEDGAWIYSFDIRPADGGADVTKEVHVDPETGKVVGVETETAADEAREKDDDDGCAAGKDCDEDGETDEADD